MSMTSISAPPPQKALEEQDEISILDILQILANNLRLLIIGPIIAGAIVFAISFLITPTFRAETKFLPPQQKQSAAASMFQSLGALGGLTGAAVGLKNPGDQYVSLLKARSVADSLIKRFDLQDRYDQKYLDTTRKILEKNSIITLGKDNIISIEVEDRDPKVSADIANAYVDELGRLLDRLALTEAQQRRVFFEKQLTDTKNKLSTAEQALAASGVSVAALNANPTTALEGPARLRAQATAQEVKIASMRSYLTDNAPEFKQALSELAALKIQLTKSEKEQANNPSIKAGGDYISKYREYKYQEALLDLFTRQFEIAKIDESREGAGIQVVDMAIPPERKSKPKKALLAILGATLFFALLAIYCYVSAALKSPRKKEDSIKIAAIQQAARKAFKRKI